jgi:hypothetical protein
VIFLSQNYHQKLKCRFESFIDQNKEEAKTYNSDESINLIHYCLQEVGLGFPFVCLVFVHGAAGFVVVLAVVFFLSVWVGSGLVGFGLDVVLVVVDASRVRHFHVAFADHVRSALVSGCGNSEGGRACRGSRHRIPIVVVRVKVSGYGRVVRGVMGLYLLFFFRFF